jgi:hypothetical protein
MHTFFFASFRNAMFDFVEDEDCKKLYVFFDSKGDLMASQKAPPNYKKNTKVRRGRHASSFVGLVAAVCAPPPIVLALSKRIPRAGHVFPYATKVQA